MIVEDDGDNNDWATIAINTRQWQPQQEYTSEWWAEITEHQSIHRFFQFLITKPSTCRTWLLVRPADHGIDIRQRCGENVELQAAHEGQDRLHGERIGNCDALLNGHLPGVEGIARLGKVGIYDWKAIKAINIKSHLSVANSPNRWKMSWKKVWANFFQLRPATHFVRWSLSIIQLLSHGTAHGSNLMKSSSSFTCQSDCATAPLEPLRVFGAKARQEAVSISLPANLGAGVCRNGAIRFP